MGSNKSKAQAKEEVGDVDGTPVNHSPPIPKSNIPSVCPLTSIFNVFFHNL
jgi:hypothetical protein